VSPSVKVRIRLGQKVRYELDGGAPPASKKLRIKVGPSQLGHGLRPVRAPRIDAAAAVTAQARLASRR
jgi:hypothetical protein